MNNMATLMRNVINGRGMPLTQISERIETLYIGGRINAEERAELIELMYKRATPDAEAGDYKELYKALVNKYNELEARVKALEDTANGENEGGENDEAPVWKPWDGVSGDYIKGAVVMHNGILWESAYDGQNVWEPGVAGIDERFWVAVQVSNEEE